MAHVMGSSITARETEAQLIARALQKDEHAIRILIQTHNRRLYRIARAILRDDHEAEDVLQEAYLRAFASLATFRGQSRFATWLSRIVMNEAFQRLRRAGVNAPLAAAEPVGPPAQVIPFPFTPQAPLDPERAMAQSEIARLLESAIDQLPGPFRAVLIARAVEGLSIEETAELLDLQPATVKTRLHRARHLLRAALSEHLEPMFADVFPFAGRRCERLTESVIARLRTASS